MAYANPSVADFKAFFSRDFPYGTDPETSVLDSDITKAFLYTNAMINPELFASQSGYTLGYQLLSAHYLVLDIRAAGQGLSGQWSWNEQSKSVGSVSQSFAIPQRILDDPYWAMLVKTNYGAQYLQMIIPQLCGAVYTAEGSTRP